jgi:general stress protein YciG
MAAQTKLTKAEAGRLGGLQTKRRHGRQHYQEAGRKGGKATLETHGTEHMRRISQAGFTATCERHYGGDRRAMLNELIRRGLRALDPCPWNRVWQNFTAFPDPPKETAETEEEDPCRRADPAVDPLSTDPRGRRPLR